MIKRKIYSVGVLSRIQAKKRKRFISEVLIKARPEKDVARSKEDLALLSKLRRRSHFILGLITIIAVLIAYRAAFVTFSPTYRVRAAMFKANLQPIFVEPLIEQAAKLKKLGKNLETTTIFELQILLAQTAQFAENATKEFESQYASWSVLRGEIKNDGTTYNELRRQLEETQRLQANELIRLREALDQAVKPSVWWDVGSAILTFFLGIVSSIFSSMTWEKLPALKKWWGNQVKNKLRKSSPLS